MNVYKGRLLKKSSNRKSKLVLSTLVTTWLSNIAFHLRPIWLQTLVAINSESRLTSFPSFCAPPSEVAALFYSNLSRRPFLGQVFDLDLLLSRPARYLFLKPVHSGLWNEGKFEATNQNHTASGTWPGAFLDLLERFEIFLGYHSLSGTSLAQICKTRIRSLASAENCTIRIISLRLKFSHVWSSTLMSNICTIFCQWIATMEAYGARRWTLLGPNEAKQRHCDWNSSSLQSGVSTTWLLSIRRYLMRH